MSTPPPPMIPRSPNLSSHRELDRREHLVGDCAAAVCGRSVLGLRLCPNPKTLIWKGESTWLAPVQPLSAGAASSARGCALTLKP